MSGKKRNKSVVQPRAEPTIFFAIVIAVIGLPIVATATLMLDVARADRRTPARRDANVASRTSVHAVATNAAHTATSEHEINTAADPNGFAARIELALSYRRIAEIRRATGALDEARVNDAAFAREAERIIADLRTLIDSRSHDDVA
jgi:hypothetical protein